jgi:hypothetical protein
LVVVPVPFFSRLNWGWRGDVSYHARGPQRQDDGDYDQVVRIVLEKLRAAEVPLDGVTVDNPYEYLVGEHFSVKLADPKSVDWLHNRLYLSAHPTATGCGACPFFQQASTACR